MMIPDLSRLANQFFDQSIPKSRMITLLGIVFILKRVRHCDLLIPKPLWFWQISYVLAF